MSKIREVAINNPVSMRIVGPQKVAVADIAGLAQSANLQALEWTANLKRFFATFHIPYAISKWRQYAVHAGHVATAAFNATSPERHARSARRPA